MDIIKKTKTASLLIMMILFVAAGYIYSQNGGNKGEEKNDNDSSYGKAENSAAAIVLSREEMEKSGITTKMLKETRHRAELIAYGSVVSINDLSNDFQNYETAKAQLAKSKENLSVSKKNYNRVKRLFEKQLASEQDYQDAHASYLSDDADVSSAHANLSVIKSEINEQWGNEISQMIINNSPKLQNLLSLKETLIQISLPTGQAGIKIPDKIFIISPQKKSKRIICKFISAGHLANSQFQTQTLYYETSNTSLIRSINLKALLPVGKELTGIIVPSSSIVWYQGKAWAYAQTSGTKFRRVEIDTGNPAGTGFFMPINNRVITSGSYVVTKGAQLLLSKELVPAEKNSMGDEDND